MSLDMTGHHRYTREVHYRRYLTPRSGIAVICVQDFDYRDYDPGRFIDLKAYGSAEEAARAPLSGDDVETERSNLDEDDHEGHFQANRILWAMHRELLRRHVDNWTPTS